MIFVRKRKQNIFKGMQQHIERVVWLFRLFFLDNPALRSTDSERGIGYVPSLNCQKKY